MAKNDEDEAFESLATALLQPPDAQSNDPALASPRNTYTPQDTGRRSIQQEPQESSRHEQTVHASPFSAHVLASLPPTLQPRLWSRFHSPYEPVGEEPDDRQASSSRAATDGSEHTSSPLDELRGQGALFDDLDPRQRPESIQLQEIFRRQSTSETRSEHLGSAHDELVNVDLQGSQYHSDDDEELDGRDEGSQQSRSRIDEEAGNRHPNGQSSLAVSIRSRAEGIVIALSIFVLAVGVACVVLWIILVVNKPSSPITTVVVGGILIFVLFGIGLALIFTRRQLLEALGLSQVFEDCTEIVAKQLTR